MEKNEVKKEEKEEKKERGSKSKVMTILLGISLFCMFSLFLLSIFNNDWLTGVVDRPKKEVNHAEKQNNQENDEENVESEDVIVVDKNKGISYTQKGIKLLHLNVKNVDLIGKVWSDNIETVEYELKPEFIIFNIVGFWTCGHGEDEILITDYDGKILYHNEKTKSGSSIKSELVYKGEYEYSDSDNALLLTYNVLCDFDCNSCEEFMKTKDKCSLYPEYKDLVVEKVYEISYSNGKFASNVEIAEETKLENDEYFKQVFDCE